MPKRGKHSTDPRIQKVLLVPLQRGDTSVLDLTGVAALAKIRKKHPGVFEEDESTIIRWWNKYRNQLKQRSGNMAPASASKKGPAPLKKKASAQKSDSGRHKSKSKSDSGRRLHSSKKVETEISPNRGAMHDTHRHLITSLTGAHKEGLAELASTLTAAHETGFEKMTTTLVAATEQFQKKMTPCKERAPRLSNSSTESDGSNGSNLTESSKESKESTETFESKASDDSFHSTKENASPSPPASSEKESPKEVVVIDDKPKAVARRSSRTRATTAKKDATVATPARSTAAKKKVATTSGGKATAKKGATPGGEPTKKGRTKRKAAEVTFADPTNGMSKEEKKAFLEGMSAREKKDYFAAKVKSDYERARAAAENAKRGNLKIG